MKIQWLVVSMLLVMDSLPAGQLSLAEAVRQERARQAKLAVSNKRAAYTNADLAKAKHQGYLTANSPHPVHAGAHPDKGQHGQAWQSRMRRAEERIKALRAKLESYENRGALYGRATRRTGRSLQLRDRRDGLEQKKAKAERDLQQALEAKQRIEEEARKAGVLPGVLRGQK